MVGRMPNPVRSGGGPACRERGDGHQCVGTDHMIPYFFCFRSRRNDRSRSPTSGGISTANALRRIRGVAL